jgi:hypothetical protein
MRTGQFVDRDRELTHSTAAPQLGWNSTCKIFKHLIECFASRWFTRLPINQSEQKIAYRSIGFPEVGDRSQPCTAPAPSGCCLCSKKVFFGSRYTRIPIDQSDKKLTEQLVFGQVENLRNRAAPQLRRDCACAARTYFLVRGTLEYHCNQASFQCTHRSADYG